MCPACIASAAVMVAGARSAAEILAVFIGKFRKYSKRIVSVRFRKQRRNKVARREERRETRDTGKGDLAMNTPRMCHSGIGEAARQQLLVREKALTRSRDALAPERRGCRGLAVENKVRVRK